jgi:hypothetical protein
VFKKWLLEHLSSSIGMCILSEKIILFKYTIVLYLFPRVTMQKGAFFVDPLLIVEAEMVYPSRIRLQIGLLLGIEEMSSCYIRCQSAHFIYSSYQYQKQA